MKKQQKKAKSKSKSKKKSQAPPNRKKDGPFDEKLKKKKENNFCSLSSFSLLIIYLVICPVVSKRFSLRSTYIAAVLNIPDPLFVVRTSSKARCVSVRLRKKNC